MREPRIEILYFVGCPNPGRSHRALSMLEKRDLGAKARERVLQLGE